MFARSEDEPIFHPYFIIYGFNKIEFYWRLFQENRRCVMCCSWLGYHFYHVPDVFGFDIPHEQEQAKKTYSENEENMMFSLYHTFINA